MVVRCLRTSSRVVENPFSFNLQIKWQFFFMTLYSHLRDTWNLKKKKKNRFWRSLVIGAEHFTTFWLVKHNSNYLFPKGNPFSATFRGGCMQPPFNNLSLGLHATPCNSPLTEGCVQPNATPFHRSLHAALATSISEGLVHKIQATPFHCIGKDGFSVLIWEFHSIPGKKKMFLGN